MKAWFLLASSPRAAGYRLFCWRKDLTHHGLEVIFALLGEAGGSRSRSCEFARRDIARWADGGR